MLLMFLSLCVGVIFLFVFETIGFGCAFLVWIICTALLIWLLQ